MKTILRCTFQMIIMILLTMRGNAQSAQYRNEADGISVEIAGMRIRVHVCDESIMRITVKREEAPAHPSLSVTRQWGTTRWTAFWKDETHVMLTTRRAGVQVDMKTGALTFLRDDQVLLREDSLYAHEVMPALCGGEETFTVRCRFRPSADEALYGLGQFEDGVMNYRGRSVTLIQNNRHVCVPFLVSTRGYGILWDNYSHTEFRDGEQGMEFWSESGDGIDYYVMIGSTIEDAIKGYREATGRAPMLPRWAFGYWQSKERYETQAEVLSVAREYRQRAIPIDNIVQDWQYWGNLGWNAMAFDPASYPDPRAMIDSLHSVYNLKLTLSIWPQVDTQTAVYKDLNREGCLFPTEIWNGGKTYDAFNPKGRDIYWQHLNKGLYSLGVDAWWADATEPDWKWCDSLLEEKEGILRNGMTAIGSSARYLNAFPLAATMGLYEHQRAATPEKRVTIMTRSAFAGQQRYSTIVWSGDISSNWKTFRRQIAAGINFCMAGIPYWNTDIGGFLPKEYGGTFPAGPRDPSYRELYVRWFQFGAFCPIFRSHGTDFGKEIWQFGKPGDWAYDALVRFDRLRYRFLPYIYSSAWKVTNEHSTLMRGLPMDFAADRRTWNIGTEYMFGASVLVAPVVRQLYYPVNPAAVIPADCFRTEDGRRGLIGTYYQAKQFDTLVCTRYDSLIHFSWQNVKTLCVGRQKFSVRWEGMLSPPETGHYEFEVTSRDGVNLWIDGNQLLDEMYPAGRQMNIAEMELQAGRSYRIKFEYQLERGPGEVSLAWRTPTRLKEYRPTSGIVSTGVYLPASTVWYDFWTGKKYEGGREVQVEVPIDRMPLFVRAGTILPLAPVRQYATERRDDTLEIRIYTGRDAQFDLYEDENDGYEYEQGAYSIVHFDWDEGKHSITIRKRQGNFNGMLKKRWFQIVLVKDGRGIGDAQCPPWWTHPMVYTGEGMRAILH